MTKQLIITNFLLLLCYFFFFLLPWECRERGRVPLRRVLVLDPREAAGWERVLRDARRPELRLGGRRLHLPAGHPVLRSGGVRAPVEADARLGGERAPGVGPPRAHELLGRVQVEEEVRRALRRAEAAGLPLPERQVLLAGVHGGHLGGGLEPRAGRVHDHGGLLLVFDELAGGAGGGGLAQAGAGRAPLDLHQLVPLRVLGAVLVERLRGVHGAAVFEERALSGRTQAVDERAGVPKVARGGGAAQGGFGSGPAVRSVAQLAPS